MRFEWDADKATANLARHGVSFDEASTVFDDPLAETVSDEDHSIDEQREITIGVSAADRPVVVWHTQRGEVIRIIGARRPTPTEWRAYESGE